VLKIPHALSRQIQFYSDNGYLGVEDVFQPPKWPTFGGSPTNSWKNRASLPKEMPPSTSNRATRGESAPAPDIEHGETAPGLPPDAGACQDARDRGQLIGPSIYCNGDKLNMKIGGVGSPVEWHQDWAFYPHTNDDLLAVGSRSTTPRWKMVA